jgi:hypothetical protein
MSYFTNEVSEFLHLASEIWHVLYTYSMLSSDWTRLKRSVATVARGSHWCSPALLK